MSKQAASPGRGQTERTARELRSLLEDLADKLDSLNFKANAANTAGATVAIVGTVLSVTGGVLSVFTLGASLVMVLLGGTLAASGGITVSASHLARTVTSKRFLRMSERKWASLKQQLHHHHHHLPLRHRSGETTRSAEQSEEKALVEKSEKILPMVDVDSAMLSLSISDLVSRGVTRHKRSGEPAGSALRELAQALRVLENKSSFENHQCDSVK